MPIRYRGSGFFDSVGDHILDTTRNFVRNNRADVLRLVNGAGRKHRRRHRGKGLGMDILKDAGNLGVTLAKKLFGPDAIRKFIIGSRRRKPRKHY